MGDVAEDTRVVVEPNYLQPGYPVTSFIYALYCDMAFAERTVRRWRTDTSWRGYLDYYKADQFVEFSREAERMIAEEVQKNPKEQTGTLFLYRPTRDQAVFVATAMSLELSGAAQRKTSPTTLNGPARTPASLNGQRPLISRLGVVFLNQDAAYKADLETFVASLPPPVQTVLREVAASKELPPRLTAHQALILLPYLIEELIGDPLCW